MQVVPHFQLHSQQLVIALINLLFFRALRGRAHFIDEGTEVHRSKAIALELHVTIRLGRN